MSSQIIQESEDTFYKIQKAFIDLAKTNPNVVTLLEESVSGLMEIAEQELTNHAIQSFPKLAIYPDGEEDYEIKGNTQIDVSSVFNFEIAVDVSSEEVKLQEKKAKTETHRLLWSIARAIKSSQHGTNLNRTVSAWYPLKYKFSPIFNPETNIIIFSAILKVRVVYSLRSMSF